MRKISNLKMLISQNKKEILSDEKLLERIEKRIDEKHHRNLKMNKTTTK